ncbi:MAG TPA: hypothetical protein VHO70_05680, partial [Chitinispirillaceae bacterium]|nr:hypothetical protein [Chitinispirillaceae bacterium]
FVLVSAVFTLTFAEGWATSEGSCYAKGDKNISAGLSMFHLGVYGMFDYGFHDAISGGGGIGFNGYTNGWWKEYYIPIVVRASFHPLNLAVLADKVPVRKKLDPYVGIVTGFIIGNAKWDGIGPEGSSYDVGGFVFREHIGARFYPSSKFYLYAEESGAFGWINLGAGLKL